MWKALPSEFLGGVDPSYPDETEMLRILGGLDAVRQGEAYLAWARFQSFGVLYDRLVAARRSSDGLIVDGFADAAARISGVFAVSRFKAEQMLSDAITLRDDLPEVFGCLRDGLLTAEQAHLVVSRTDLLESGSSVTPLVDAAIAAAVRGRRGTWKRARLRDMVDRVVFRHDPDCVRERRQRELDKRGMWTENRGDGTAEISAVMSAENVRIAAQSVTALADAACERDGRTRPQRASDAMFALLTGTQFECLCDTPDCAAAIPAPATIPPADPKIVIHVVCDESALAATTPTDDDTTTARDDATATPVAFIAGHGIISADHLRDLSARADAVIKPIVPRGTEQNPDGTFTLPASAPADPYRPSAALDDGVRVRDGYCVEPGCEMSSWDSDLDHVTEFDHADPASGGQTTDDNLNAKCRRAHIHKTFGDWVDDQYRDPVTGRIVTEFITPEGYVFLGDAETLEDTFPGLRRLRFAPPGDEHPGRRRRRQRLDDDEHPTPRRTRTRAANKHARRSAERHRNRRRRHQLEHAAGDPPF